MLFCLWISGLDSAFSYVEAINTNIMDFTKLPRPVSALIVTIMGISMTALFTTNIGWILFDMVDHYTSDYMVLAIVLMQCISVGWQFEADTTSAMSDGHRKAQKALGTLFWVPVVLLGFYAHFGFAANKEVALLVMIVTTMIACIVSKTVSGMTFSSWFYEIFGCGVGKLSMSITHLSNENGERSGWMPAFEFYFACAIKFINPAILTYMLFENFYGDVNSPYAEQPMDMQVLSSIIIVLMVFLVFVPMFICEYPEIFEHNIDLEFMADVIFEAKIRAEAKGKVLPTTEMSKINMDTNTQA